MLGALVVVLAGFVIRERHFDQRGAIRCKGRR